MSNDVTCADIPVCALPGLLSSYTLSKSIKKSAYAALSDVTVQSLYGCTLELGETISDP